MPRQITINSKSYIVQATHILGTCSIVLSAWEAMKFKSYSHSTITTFEIDGKAQWYGKVSTRNISDELNALPAYTEERYQAVKAHYAELNRESEMVIKATFPETQSTLFNSTVNSFGEIEVVGASVEAARNYARLCNEPDTF